MWDFTLCLELSWAIATTIRSWFMNTAVYSGPVMEPDSLCHTELQKSLMSGREGGCMYGKKGGLFTEVWSGDVRGDLVVITSRMERGNLAISDDWWRDDECLNLGLNINLLSGPVRSVRVKGGQEGVCLHRVNSPSSWHHAPTQIHQPPAVLHAHNQGWSPTVKI